MKLADLIESTVEKFPSLELDIETTDGHEYSVTFRNFLLLSEEERRDFTKLEEAVVEPTPAKAGARKKAAPKAEEPESRDAIASEADAAKTVLSRALKPVEGADPIADLDAYFTGLGHRDICWINLAAEWTKVTKLGEAKSSQES